jgi:hypothetical protein
MSNDTPPTGPTHNGRLIVGQKVEFRKMGGEFSEDLIVANPELLDGVTVGSRVTVAVDLVCIDEHFPAEDRKEPEDGGVFQKLVFDPEAVVVINRSKVAKDFKAQEDAVQAAKDAAIGQESISSQLVAQHEAGEHASGLVDDCPECEAEAALVAAGK